MSARSVTSVDSVMERTINDPSFNGRRLKTRKMPVMKRKRPLLSLLHPVHVDEGEAVVAAEAEDVVVAEAEDAVVVQAQLLQTQASDFSA